MCRIPQKLRIRFNLSRKDSSVVLALEARIRAVADNPGIGRPTPRDDVREAVEARYGFLIPYYLRGSRLYVLRVYRSNRQPLEYETLKVEK